MLYTLVAIGLDPTHYALAEQPPNRQLPRRLSEETGGLPYLQVFKVFYIINTLQFYLLYAFFAS